MKRFLLFLLCSLGWVLHSAQQPVQLQVRTLADLSAWSVVSWQTNLTALVNGGSSMGDADWGSWYFCPGDTTTADGTTVITSTGVSGRWKKLTGYVVTTYGFSSADTSGTVNAAAITNAINAGYRSLEFPSGSYYVASLGVVTNDYELIGDQKREGSPTVFIAPDSVTTLSTLTNSSVTLKGLTFDGYYTGIADSYYASGTNFVVTNMIGSIVMKDCVWTNLVFSALWSYYGGNGLLYEPANTKLFRAEIDGCKFYPDNANGVGIAWMGKPFSDFAVNNCEFVGGSIGLFLGVDDVGATILNPSAVHRGFRVTRNKFLGQNTYGAQLMCGGGMVSENIFEAIYDSDPSTFTCGIYAFCDHTVFTANQFLDCGGVNGAAMYVKGAGLIDTPNAEGFGNIITANQFRQLTNNIGGTLVVSFGNNVVNNTFHKCRGFDSYYPALYMFTDYTNRVMAAGSIVGNSFYGAPFFAFDDYATWNQKAVIELRTSGSSSSITNVLIQGNQFYNIMPNSSDANAIHLFMASDATCVLDGMKVYDNQFNVNSDPGGGVKWGGIYLGAGANAVVKNLDFKRNTFAGASAFIKIPSGTTVSNIIVMDNLGPNTLTWLTNSGTINGQHIQLDNQNDSWFPSRFSYTASPDTIITAPPGSFAQTTVGSLYVKRYGTSTNYWGRLYAWDKVAPISAITNIIVNDKGFDDRTQWITNGSNWAINDGGYALSKAVKIAAGAGSEYLQQSYGTSVSGRSFAYVMDVDALSGGVIDLQVGGSTVYEWTAGSTGTFITSGITTPGAATYFRIVASQPALLTIDNMDILGLDWKYTMPSTAFATGSTWLGLEFDLTGYFAANGNNKRIYMFASDTNTRAKILDSTVLTDNDKMWRIHGTILRGSDNNTSHVALVEFSHGDTYTSTKTIFNNVDMSTAWVLWLCSDITAAADVVLSNGGVTWIKQ